MGWLTMPFASMGKHKTAAAYLDAQFTYDRQHDDGTSYGLKVLASSCPGNKVYYAAAQAITNGVAGEIFAIICLVRWSPNSSTGENFGYKDMDESMGPHEAECPERILNLLTPTDKPYALDWRNRCVAALRRRSRSIRNGDRIRLAEPLQFTDGSKCADFTVAKCGRSLRFYRLGGVGPYSISHFMDRNWVIIPVTKVHKLVFG